MRDSHKKEIIENFKKEKEALYDGFKIEDIEINCFQSEDNNLSIKYFFEINYKVKSQFITENKTERFLEKEFVFDDFIPHRY